MPKKKYKRTFNYVFITKDGGVLHKRLTPSKATEIGKREAIRFFGLKSKFVFPKKGRKRKRKK